MSPFVLLEVDRVRVDSSRFVVATLNIDDPGRERACSVEVVYDFDEEDVIDARAQRTWGCDLFEREIQHEDRKWSSQIEAFARTARTVRDALHPLAERQYRELAEDEAAQNAWDRDQVRMGRA